MLRSFPPINRFLQDSAELTRWMGGAREQIDRWSRLSVSAGEEMDAEQTRDYYLQFVVSMN